MDAPHADPAKKSTEGMGDLINCGCGCGATLRMFDDWGRERKFVRGHFMAWAAKTLDPRKRNVPRHK